jgi:16S rRNA pseudouridine516 synthase
MIPKPSQGFKEKALSTGLKRLDQIIANCGYASRSEAKALIREGRVTVDGNAVADTGLRVNAASVRIDGEPLDHPDGLFFALNKPAGYACSRNPSESPLVFELLPERWNLRNPEISTIGRLDRDTSGLILLTDIPGLVHALASPKKGTEKVYEAVLDRPAKEEWIALFASGKFRLPDEEKPCLPARLEITGDRTARLTLTEGRFHQVRRMFETAGATVLELKRTRFGEWTLDGLEEGELRILPVPY